MKEVKIEVDIESLRQLLYSASPHDLATTADDTYRDAIDHVINKIIF